MTDTTVTRAQLAEAVYQEVGLSRNDSAQLVDEILEKISVALIKGGSVKLSSFGSFQVRSKGERIGRNPNAPATDVPIPARSIVKFKAGKEMRAEVLKLPTKPAPGIPKPPAKP